VLFEVVGVGDGVVAMGIAWQLAQI